MAETSLNKPILECLEIGEGGCCSGFQSYPNKLGQNYKKNVPIVPVFKQNQ